MIWSDGSSYKGDWKKGQPNGLGIADKTQVRSTSRERSRRWGCFKTTLIKDITRFCLQFRGVYILFSQK